MNKGMVIEEKMIYCPICKSAEMEHFASYQSWVSAAEKLKDEPYEVLKKTQKIPSAAFDCFLQCIECKLIQSFPLPNRSTITEYYQDTLVEVDFGKRINKSINRSAKNINVLKKIIGGEAFLDVGCGVGGAAYNASLNGFKSTGIDIDRRSLDVAKDNFPNCQFINCSIEKFIKEKMEFDLVYASEIIEHIPDINSFVKNMAQLTKKDGYLFITTPKVVMDMLSNPKSFVEWHLVGPPEHLFYFNQLNLKKLLEKYGFKIIKFFPLIQGSLRVLAQK